MRSKVGKKRWNRNFREQASHRRVIEQSKGNQGFTFNTNTTLGCSMYNSRGHLANSLCPAMPLGLSDAPALPSSALAANAVRRVHKFGGSSLATAHHYKHVADLVREHTGPCDILVVSAAGQTTNHLIEWVERGKDNCQARSTIACKIRQFQQGLIRGLLNGEEAHHYAQLFEQDFASLQSLVLREKHSAEVVGYGEIWSARLLAAYLAQSVGPSQFVDARSILRAEAAPQPLVDLPRSERALQAVLEAHPSSRLVITGFIARDDQNQTVLLGRNGSDYSATCIGRIAHAKEVVIWSDVAGVYSADPKRVEGATLQPRISMAEADELARRGAGVLHSRSLLPVRDTNVQVTMRSSLQPRAGETRVLQDCPELEPGFRSLVACEEVYCFRVPLSRNVDTERAAGAIGKQLNQASIEPLLISVGPRELSIVVTDHVAPTLQSMFPESRCESEYSLISAIGTGVDRNVLVQSGFNETFREHRVGLVASTPCSLSVLVETDELCRLVRQLHSRIVQ